MTAVSTLVQDAMFAAQVLGQDQTPSSGDSQLVLRRFQRMLDSWSTERSLIYSNDVESFSLVAGQQSYSTSLLANGRPISIASMRVNLNNIDYPVDQIDQLKWNEISYKLTTAIPNVFYYDGAFPNATMFFYPVPYAAFTCYLYCQRKLSGTLALATDLSLPSGYEAAMVAALAVDIGPSFGKPATALMIQDMKEKRATIKRVNFQPLEMDTPFDDMGSINNAFPYRGF